VKLIVGLGNPGPKYRDTLHNVGFMTIDALAARHGATFEMAPADAYMARIRGVDGGLLLVKPLTFVNLSGGAVGTLLRFFKIPVEDLLVVLDEVALPAGQLRARPEGSAGGHNGLKSIIGALGTQQFARLRIGVGRGDPRRDLADHVLSSIGPDLRPIVDEAVVKAADAVECFARDGIEKTMQVFNAPPSGRRDSTSLPPQAERSSE
jgi:PTH1 family peptidyl-tRNA hydrolase